MFLNIYVLSIGKFHWIIDSIISHSFSASGLTTLKTTENHFFHNFLTWKNIFLFEANRDCIILNLGPDCVWRGRIPLIHLIHVACQHDSWFDTHNYRRWLDRRLSNRRPCKNTFEIIFSSYFYLPSNQTLTFRKALLKKSHSIHLVCKLGLKFLLQPRWQSDMHSLQCLILRDFECRDCKRKKRRYAQNHQ